MSVLADSLGRTMTRIRLCVLASAALFVTLAVVVPTSAALASVPAVSGIHTAATSTASSALAALPVKGRAPKTGYSRAQFGPAWTDSNNNALGHNGCDTRNDMLRRDLSRVAYKSGHCVVKSGVLADPYTGKRITFVRGASTSSAVQIDHVVALSNAWQTGAQKLTSSQRVDFANDPYVLLAADGPSNQRKGDGDAATWLPPSKSYRCAYVARQVGIKTKYRLWVTSAERAAIARVLATCPGQKLPPDAGKLRGSSSTPTPAPSSSTTPAPAPTPTLAPTTPAAPTSADVYYANCTAARAAGAAPIHRGEPGYRSGLDRDGDGIACE